MDNFGFSLFVISTALLLVISLVLFGAYILKRIGYHGKLLERISQYKKSIFFNILITYSLLNGLKYNILACTSLYRSDSDAGSKLLGALLLSLFIVLPLYYAYLLQKREKEK